MLLKSQHCLWMHPYLVNRRHFPKFVYMQKDCIMFINEDLVKYVENCIFI